MTTTTANATPSIVRTGATARDHGRAVGLWDDSGRSMRSPSSTRASHSGHRAAHSETVAPQLGHWTTAPILGTPDRRCRRIAVRAMTSTRETSWPPSRARIFGQLDEHPSALRALEAAARFSCGRRRVARSGNLCAWWIAQSKRTDTLAGTVLGAMVAMFTSGDVSMVQASCIRNYFDHQGLGGEPVRGPSGFAKVVAAARSSHAGLEVSIQDLLVADDRAAARLQWHGTRLDGDVVRRETIEIIRIDHGKRWSTGVLDRDHSIRRRSVAPRRSARRAQSGHSLRQMPAAGSTAMRRLSRDCAPTQLGDSAALSGRDGR